MAQDIETGNDRGTGSKQGRVRVKPTRKVSSQPVCYPLPLYDTLFRFDSICSYLVNIYGKDMSRYQIKVLVSFAGICDKEGLIGLSYFDVTKSGAVRGMNWRDIHRSMEILHGFGLLETFGRTQGGNHYKYVLSHEGDRLMGWIDAEMACPSVTLTFKSKAFSAPGHAA